MTFVIAKVFSDSIVFHADTRTWDPRHATRRGALEMVLKVWILRGDICVAFSGNIEVARGIHESISAMVCSPEVTGVDIVTALARRQVDLLHEGGDAPDFLVGFINFDGFRLFRVSEGGVEPDMSSAWIGDERAFEQFQERWHRQSLPPSTPEEHRNVFHNVFRDLLLDVDIDSVGDFHVSARGKDGFFRYLTHGCTYYPQTMISMREVVTSLGDTARGGFSCSCLVSVRPGRPALAFVFAPGRLAVLLLPERPLDPIRYSDHSDEDILAAVRDEHNVVLCGTITKERGEVVLVGEAAFDMRLGLGLDAKD